MSSEIWKLHEFLPKAHAYAPGRRRRRRKRFCLVCTVIDSTAGARTSLSLEAFLEYVVIYLLSLGRTGNRQEMQHGGVLGDPVEA